MTDKPKKPKKHVVEDEVTPVDAPIILAAPAVTPPAEVCVVCGTLRLGLAPTQACPVDGYAPVAP